MVHSPEPARILGDCIYQVCETWVKAPAPLYPYPRPLCENGKTKLEQRVALAHNRDVQNVHSHSDLPKTRA